MRGQRFDAECLGRVMATENKIDSEFFCRDRGPMRRFAGDESVDILPVRSASRTDSSRGELGLRGYAINFSACAASDDPDVLRILRAGVKRFHRSAKHL